MRSDRPLLGNGFDCRRRDASGRVCRLKSIPTARTSRRIHRRAASDIARRTSTLPVLEIVRGLRYAAGRWRVIRLVHGEDITALVPAFAQLSDERKQAITRSIN